MTLPPTSFSGACVVVVAGEVLDVLELELLELELLELESEEVALWPLVGGGALSVGWSGAALRAVQPGARKSSERRRGSERPAVALLREMPTC